jgi:protein-tyrosine phosphatase
VRRFAVLAVCTANICRSPMMELMLRDGLDLERFEVASAGVHGYDGALMDPDAATELAAFGLDASEFRSRHLEPYLVETADLVLTATREHRSAVLALHPVALRRTFTLLEFAELARGHRSPTVEDLVAHAARRRSEGPTDADVPDPYRRGADVHRAVAHRIQHAVEQVTGALRDLPRQDTPRPLR